MAENKFDRSELRSIEEELIANKTLQEEAVDWAKELSKVYKEQNAELKTSFTYHTKSRDLQQQILDVSARVGNTFVSKGRIEQLKAETAQLKETLTQKIKGMNADKARKDYEDKIAQAQDKVAKAKTARSRKSAEELLESVKKAIPSDVLMEDLLKMLIDNAEQSEEALNKIGKSLSKANIEAEILERKSRLIEKMFGSLSRIPIIGPLLSARVVADAFSESLGTGLKTLKAIGISIVKSGVFLATLALGSIALVIAMFKKAYEEVLKIDESIVSMANSLGIAKEGATAIAHSLAISAKGSDVLDGALENSFITMKNMGESLTKLQEGFGVNAMLSESTLQSQILLTKQMGLSEEEALGLQKISTLNNINAKQLVDITLRQGKHAISYRKVLKEISQIRGELAVAYRVQPDLLAKAVIQANKLGMSLEDTKKIADSLLNFESSIENELKAELLINKSLNFEKARALALDGKSAEAAGELMRQMGGLNGITSLNVIQRKALAESIGLSAEELSKFSQQQSIVNKLGSENKAQLVERVTALREMGKHEEANALLRSIQKQEGGDLLAQDIARVSLNQRLQNSLDQLKETFADLLAGPIIGIVKAMGDLAQSLSKNTGLLKGLVAGAISLAAALTAAAIASALASGGATWVAGAAIIGGGLALGAMSGMGDSGAYGEDTVGSIMSNTPRVSALPGSTSGGYTNNNINTNEDVVAELRKTNQLLSRKGEISMSGMKVGTAMAISNTPFA